MPRGTAGGTSHSQLVTLTALREWRREADLLRSHLASELGDMAIDRALRTVVFRLGKYAEKAASRKTQSLTTEEIEAAALEEE